jgi:hypothetical protein
MQIKTISLVLTVGFSKYSDSAWLSGRSRSSLTWTEFGPWPPALNASKSFRPTRHLSRHGRFHESKLFEQLFEQIVRQCVEVGLVRGKELSVDGSFVEANAAKESRIPREQLAEVAQANHTVRQFLVELEEQNPVEEPVHEQDQVSTTDPDSTYATKGGTPARLGYYDNYLVDNASCVIVGVQATAARMSQETVAAQDMLTRFAE